MNHLILKELKEKDSFNPLSICKDFPFTQARFYGEWQKEQGRGVLRYVVMDDKKEILFFQMIRYNLLFGKSYFYIPYGPVTKDLSLDVVIFFKKELEKICKGKNIVFVRLDFTPPVGYSLGVGGADVFMKKIFTKAPNYTYQSANFQPRAEWFLSLDKPEDVLLKEMHEKTRYSIKLSYRKGVVSEIVHSSSKSFFEYFDIFYDLMLATAVRNKFNIHSRSYYQNIFNNLQKNTHPVNDSSEYPSSAYLSIAKYNGQVLAVDLVVVYCGVANYIFGGSSDESRNLMPTYLAQWAAICEAKRSGASFYNFGGISSGGRNKGWDGITLFKKKFGGQEVIHSDFFDIIYQGFWYKIYNLRKYLKSIKNNEKNT